MKKTAYGDFQTTNAIAAAFPKWMRTANWLGLFTLARREVQCFLAVWTQTLLAPLVTAGLFLAIFTLAIGRQRADVMGVPFVQFLLPGILMMTVIQNAFANTSSSIVIAKVQGNIVDTLMSPLSAGELVLGYVAGGVLRGAMVAGGAWTMAMLVPGGGVSHPLWVFHPGRSDRPSPLWPVHGKINPA